MSLPTADSPVLRAAMLSCEYVCKASVSTWCVAAVMYIFNFNSTLCQNYVAALIPCMVDTASLAGGPLLSTTACTPILAPFWDLNSFAVLVYLNSQIAAGQSVLCILCCTGLCLFGYDLLDMLPIKASTHACSHLTLRKQRSPSSDAQ